MSIKQESEPRKEQLARLEVPRVSVDLLGDELTGRQKLSVIKYLTLEDSISSLGLQKFDKTTIDNIHLKPVRDWVQQHWNGEFVLDMSKRNIPISFRASLGLALLATRIAEHLSGIEGGVEAYATNSIQKVFKRHNLPIPQGLTIIDYALLSPQVKSDLVLPIIDNLSSVQLVMQAKVLFPNGVPTDALYLVDPSMIMVLAFSGNKDGVISFNKIKNLDVQAMAAEIALNNIGRIGELSAIVKTTETRGKDKKKGEVGKEEKYSGWEDDDDKEPELHYSEGTRFTQVFIYRDGETEEDMLRAYRRITGGEAYNCSVEEPHRGEYLKAHISNEGKLIGHYGWNKSLAVDLSIQKELDMLSGKLGDEYTDNYRRKAVRALISDLRDDMDANKQALNLAKQEYGQTSFTVEKGFFQALTDRYRKEVTEAEIEEDKRLAREAKKTAAQLSGEDIEKATTQLTRISEKPVDAEAVNLDYRILSAIQSNYNLSDTQLLRVFGGTLDPAKIDNIGGWFASCRSLINRYQSVVVDIGHLFLKLDISPTNDEQIIRGAYRKIAHQTHPDKTSGLNPEERLKAARMFQEATEALEDIKSRIGTVNPNRLAPTYYLGRIGKLFGENSVEE